MDIRISQKRRGFHIYFIMIRWTDVRLLLCMIIDGILMPRFDSGTPGSLVFSPACSDSKILAFTSMIVLSIVIVAIIAKIDNSWNAGPRNVEDPLFWYN